MIADDLIATMSPQIAEKFKTVYQKTAKVRIQNVSDYYYTSPQEHWQPKDFPCVSPPWPAFWMEWHTSSIFYSDHPHPRTLARVKHEKLADGTYRFFAKEREPRGCIGYAAEPDWVKEFGARWMLRLQGFEVGYPMGGFVFEYTFFISPEGELLHLKAMNQRHRDLIENYLNIKFHDKSVIPRPEQILLPHTLSPFLAECAARGLPIPDQNFFDVIFLALSFCNCKNVRVVKNTVAEKLRKRREKKGRPLNPPAFYTISIDPMRKIMERGEGSGMSVQRRLHIFRGHFKTFDTRALFGKHFGRYFWPMHVRGDAKLGTVRKQYVVKAGEEEKEGE